MSIFKGANNYDMHSEGKCVCVCNLICLIERLNLSHLYPQIIEKFTFFHVLFGNFFKIWRHLCSLESF